MPILMQGLTCDATMVAKGFNSTGLCGESKIAELSGSVVYLQVPFTATNRLVRMYSQIPPIATLPPWWLFVLVNYYWPFYFVGLGDRQRSPTLTNGFTSVATK